jgi:hypothetical protein
MCRPVGRHVVATIFRGAGMKNEWINGTVEIIGSAVEGKMYTTIARKHRKRGNVQFELRKDFWYDMNTWWWPSFKPAQDSGVPQNERPTATWRSLCKWLKSHFVM